MNNPTQNIENWSPEGTQAIHSELDAAQIAPQEKNQGWWENFPMTYQNWGDDDRIPCTPEEFEELDTTYFVTNPYLTQEFDFAAYQGKEVLEIGCGAGSAACRFAQHGAKVTAVDITAKAVDLTAQNARIKNVTVDVRQMDAEKLEGLTDHSFDHVYSWGVLHHSSDPDATFRQVARVLKPGGSWMIMVYHKNSLRYWGKGLFHLLLRGKWLKGLNFETVQTHFTDGFYHKHYSADQLRQDLETAGLKVSRTDVTHMSSRMIPGIPETLRQALKRRIGWLLVARG